MVFLGSYTAFGGGSIGNMLSQWEAAGIFSYALPFLLIFAIVYSVLSFVNVFKDNRAVNAVISLSVALLALQFQLVSVFFSEIFPRMGVALSVLLVIVILGGIFINPKDGEHKGWIKWALVGVTVVVLIFVLGGSFRSFGLGGNLGIGFLYGVNWGSMFVIALIVGAFIWIVASTNNDSKPSKKP